MKKAVLFDLDGTLWDSAIGVCRAWNLVLEKHGMEAGLTVDAIHGMMGKQMDVIAAILFPDKTKEEQLALMDECAEQEHDVLSLTGGILFPQVEETLAALGEKYTLAVISNCQSGYIETFFEAHGLQRYFADTECFGNTGLSKGENIALVMKRGGFGKAVYIGDTLGDHEAAIHAGIPFIHAAYGFGRVEDAKYRINSIAELPVLAESLLD